MEAPHAAPEREDPRKIANGMTLADISIRNHVFAWILMEVLGPENPTWPPQVLGFIVAAIGMVAGSLLPHWVGRPSPLPSSHEHHAAGLTHHVGEHPHRHDSR